MSKNWILALVVTLVLYAGVGSAKMVYYFDENGKIHYVNTDFSKVPEKYLRQVASQLEEPDPSPEVSVTPEDSGTPSPQPTISEKRKAVVELFVSDGCPECDQMALLMRARGINFTSFDVNHSPQGKAFLQDEKGAISLPVTRVNGQKVQGLDIRQISDLIWKAENGQN